MPRPRRPPRPGALSELPPLKILTQILILQLLYYTCATVLILFTVLVAGQEKFSADLVLGWRGVRADTTVGWTLGLDWLLVAVMLTIPLTLLLHRSRLVPDFALTLHFLHLVITSLYTRSLPSNWLWWALQVVSAGVMTALGLWLARWRELKPISFGGGGGGGGGGTTTPGQASNSNNAGFGEGNTELGGEGDLEDQGESRGRGRGRGRDGAGVYEMLGLSKNSTADGEG
ncbi:MAG: hypothetical protein M1827_001748 [Pycnora praestabilis]|nr:MAG: hypothetical protein M1827_001748 [Pycnora praestabilis]